MSSLHARCYVRSVIWGYDGTLIWKCFKPAIIGSAESALRALAIDVYTK